MRGALRIRERGVGVSCGVKRRWVTLGREEALGDSWARGGAESVFARHAQQHHHLGPRKAGARYLLSLVCGCHYAMSGTDVGYDCPVRTMMLCGAGIGYDIQLKLLKTDIEGPLKAREGARAGRILVNERRCAPDPCFEEPLTVRATAAHTHTPRQHTHTHTHTHLGFDNVLSGHGWTRMGWVGVGGLLAVCAKQPKLWRLKHHDSPAHAGLQHTHPLVAALYNAAFHQ
eukprot:2233039-Rhodomonas_salina.1